MKNYFYRCLIGLLIFYPWSLIHAETMNVASKSDSYQSCVYNYTSCRDSCEYYQDRSQIEPCKTKCDRSFKCRPKKIEKPSKTKDFSDPY